MHGLQEYYLLLNVLMSLGLTVHGSVIIHGKKAPENSMRYMVSVQSERYHVCGGFLISEDFVVTAAHCADRESLHHVVLGSHDLKGTNARKIKIEHTCKPKSYENVGLGYDIMLVKLAHKAPLWNGAETIPLPTSEITLKENQSCTVAGWGNTEKDHYGVNDLRAVNVSIINPQDCVERWNGLPPNVICAGGFGTDKGFCQGDSGGPLVCNGKAVGVVSFNRNRTCKYPDVPNVYTDVFKYLPWIKQNLMDFKCVP